MYGKWFDSAYTGSMAGAGADVFAVMSYAVAHTADSFVELNPAVVAALIGMPVENVERAIEFLCRPDPKSRNPAHEGRRLIYQSGHRYQIVSQPIYRALRTAEDRREYMRAKQQESRARRKEESTETKTETKTEPYTDTESTIVNRCQPLSTTVNHVNTQSVKDAVAPAAGFSQSNSNSNSNVHDTAEMIASAVIDTTGLTGRWVRDALVKQAEYELRHTAGTENPATMEELHTGMSTQWRKYSACVQLDRIRLPVTPERFFSDGMWKSSKTWQFKKGMSADGIVL